VYKPFSLSVFELLSVQPFNHFGPVRTLFYPFTYRYNQTCTGSTFPTFQLSLGFGSFPEGFCDVSPLCRWQPAIAPGFHVFSRSFPIPACVPIFVSRIVQVQLIFFRTFRRNVGKIEIGGYRAIYSKAGLVEGPVVRAVWVEMLYLWRI
jgi:hypothetical protein